MFPSSRPLSEAGWTGTPRYIGLYGLLFSSGKGAFWYNPLLLLLIPAWPRFYKAFRVEALFFALHTILVLVFVSALPFWHGDYSWGPRLPTWKSTP